MRLLLLVLIFCSNSLLALEDKVVKVYDGDTITILDSNKVQHKIRLAQIDAPELGQPWGKNSRKSLNHLVTHKTVTIDVVDTDRYGRIVGTVFVDGQDFCREQVATGHAWVYQRYMTDRTLISYEKTARGQKLGLWSDSKPVPPWEWRKR